MKKTGMTTLEVCVLMAIAAAALLASEKYFRGALQGNWRGNADAFSDEQYNPSDDEALDPGSSSESGGYIAVINPTLQAKAIESGAQLGTFDLATTSSQYIQLSGWGNYSDSRSHDD